MNIVEYQMRKPKTYDMEMNMNLLTVILPIATLLIGFFLQRIVSGFDRRRENQFNALINIYSPLHVMGCERCGYNATLDDLPINEDRIVEIKYIIEHYGHYLSHESMCLYVDFIAAKNENDYFMSKVKDCPSDSDYSFEYRPVGDIYRKFQESVDNEYNNLVKKLKIQQGLKYSKMPAD